MSAEVSDKKWQQLRERMAQLGIEETAIIEKYTIGSGKGGQKVNKTANCVVLTYQPLDLQIRCQKTRSRQDNRFFARRLLCEKAEALLQPEFNQQKTQVDKIRKQKQRRKRRQKSV